MQVLNKSAFYSLKFLEEVRVNIESGFPSIDPMIKTIYLCGSRNVGKSTFLNELSQFSVVAQPYAFETMFVSIVEHQSER